MKKSISVWSFPFDWPIEKKLRLAKEAGFAGFEIDLSDDGSVNLKSADADLITFRKLVEQHGLELSGLATGLYWGANAASADATHRKKAEDILQHQIRCAKGLGLDAILVVPGSVGFDFMPCPEIVPYDKVLERAGAFIRTALPAAEKAGVTICVENVWNKFLLSPLEMRDFIDSFSHANVASYFDVGNILAIGYPEHWIPILGKRIKRVHFKDYRRGVGSAEGFVDLLSGDVNWPAVISALRNVGYKGWIAAEMIPPAPFYKYSTETLIHNTSRAMDAIFKLA